MTKYNIFQVEDPQCNKNQIITFWDKYLANTSHGRFEWLTSNNPAGNVIWFYAVLKDTNELVGTVSLLHKNIYYNNQMYRGAIMGDLMVDENHRVFGPALSLLKFAVKSMKLNNLDFIYTAPNTESKNVVQRAGLTRKTDMGIYVKPINITYYLSKYLPNFIAKMLSPFAKVIISDTRSR